MICKCARLLHAWREWGLSRLAGLAGLPGLSRQSTLSRLTHLTQDRDELPLAVFLPLVVNHNRFFIAVGGNADQTAASNLLRAPWTADGCTE